MTKVYNVWLDIEEIDEEKDIEGHDIDTIKLGKFETPTDAVIFHKAVTKMAVAVVKMFPGRIDNERTVPLNPNCSESVIKFYTLDVKQMQQILQAIKYEILSKYDTDDRDWLEPQNTIPLLAEAKMYDTGWNGERLYHGSIREKYNKEIAANWKMRDQGKISKEKALENYGEIQGRMAKEIYPNTLLKACAGLGDNEGVITVQNDGFILNIGNNDIQPGTRNDGTAQADVDTTSPRYQQLMKKSWVELVKEMGLTVQEAEYSEELTSMARDCTCGVTFFDGYKNLIADPDFEELLKKAGFDIDTKPIRYVEDKNGDWKRDENGNPIMTTEAKDLDDLTRLFKIWRKAKKIKPHLTTVEHAKQFITEPVPAETEVLSEDPFVEGDTVKGLEKRRKALVKKYAAKQ